MTPHNAGHRLDLNCDIDFRGNQIPRLTHAQVQIRTIIHLALALLLLGVMRDSIFGLWTSGQGQLVMFMRKPMLWVHTNLAPFMGT